MCSIPIKLSFSFWGFLLISELSGAPYTVTKQEIKRIVRKIYALYAIENTLAFQVGLIHCSDIRNHATGREIFVNTAYNYRYIENDMICQ